MFSASDALRAYLSVDAVSIRDEAAGEMQQINVVLQLETAAGWGGGGVNQ